MRDEFSSVTYVVHNTANDAFDLNNDVMTMQLLQSKGRTGVVNFRWFMYLMYDDTDISLEIAPITKVMAIKAKGSANYGPPCMLLRSALIQSYPSCAQSVYMHGRIM